MRTAIFLTFSTLAALSGAQDLYTSFERSASHYGNQPVYQGSSYPFKVGFVDSQLQPMMSWPINPYVKQDGFDYDKAFGVRDTTFQSCVWWNFGQSDLVVNGLTMKGSVVTMHSVDKIPVIEVAELGDVVRLRGTGKTVTVSTSAYASDGASTPGHLLMKAYYNGIWHAEYEFNINSVVSDSHSIDITSDLIIRLLLVRTGASRASAVVKFHYKIDN